MGDRDSGNGFHTEANADRLLQFRDAFAKGDHEEAYNAIYWLVSDNAADPFHPWRELEALAAGAAHPAREVNERRNGVGRDSCPECFGLTPYHSDNCSKGARNA